MKQLFFLMTLFICCIQTYGLEIYGHRGARGLAPENTLPAYQVALKTGIDYVDMDVAMTKDHEVVVQHDLSLNPDITRNSDGKWISNNNILVKNLTLKELQKFDVGEIKSNTYYSKLFHQQKPRKGIYIPTLRQVIRYVKTNETKPIGFQIEIKTDPTHPDLAYSPQELATAVVKIVEEENIVNRTQIQAFDWRCLLEVQKLNPHIATAYLTDTELEKLMRNKNDSLAGLWTAGKLLKNYHSIPHMIKAMGGKYWDLQDTEITEQDIKDAHRLGLKVNAWSWAEQSGKDIDLPLVKKLIAMGVDGIITDRPDEMKKIL